MGGSKDGDQFRKRQESARGAAKFEKKKRALSDGSDKIGPIVSLKRPFVGLTNVLMISYIHSLYHISHFGIHLLAHSFVFSIVSLFNLLLDFNLANHLPNINSFGRITR